MHCESCDICDSFQKEHLGSQNVSQGIIDISSGIMFRYADNGWDHHRIFYTKVTETPKTENKAAAIILESKTFEHFIELPKFFIWKYILSLFWNENMF